MLGALPRGAAEAALLGYSPAAPFGAPADRSSLSRAWRGCVPVSSPPYCPPRLSLGVGPDRTGPNSRLGSSGAAFIGRGGFWAPWQVFQVTNHPQGQEHCAGIRGEQVSLLTLLGNLRSLSEGLSEEWL